MPGLLSGSLLRKGGSGSFIDLASAQPQLPQTPTTSTGYTVKTDSFLVTTYASSLGNIEFNFGSLKSNTSSGSIRVLSTGANTISTSTNTGLLVVEGGVGVGGSMNIKQDIVINGITFGRGYEGINNIVIRGSAATPVDSFENGQESIAIGYDALLGLTTVYKSIAIGRYALNSGTNISNSIAIGDSALKNAGVYQTFFVATITNITTGTTTIVTAPGHNLSTGTAIRLLNIQQPTQFINSNVYYVGTPTTSTFVLYTDITRTTLLNSTAYNGTYLGTGTVNTVVYQDQNIAIGVDAATKLINGENNVFIAHAAAQNWTTGSNNVIIGQNTARFINTGSGIISIGGDNLVDGVDNQVNIGSVFYFDGTGYSYIASELNVGLGTIAAITSPGPFTSTSTMTGGLVVVGGIASYRNAIIGTSMSILGTDTSTSTTTGALTVAGGVGISGDLNIGGNTKVSGTILPTVSDVFDLGSPTARFKTLYLSSATLNLGGATLSAFSTVTNGTTSTGIALNGTTLGYGYSGSIGYVGSTGVGFVGSRGITGSIGFTGSSGSGYTGSAGAASTATGVLGYTGSQGINSGISWSISASTASDYVFNGPGIESGNTNDPVLYLYKGFTYIFVNTTGGSHPFAIRVSNGGSDYTTGVSGSQSGTQTFIVPMNAPATLYYQCTLDSSMGNTINIV